MIIIELVRVTKVYVAKMDMELVGKIGKEVFLFINK